MTQTPNSTMQRGDVFFCKGEKIVLKKDGTWIADGVEITHGQTVELFFRSVQFDTEKKSYFLKIGYEVLYIEVEDTAYFVKALHDHIASGLFAEISNGEKEKITPDHLFYENKALYLILKNKQKALFLSSPFYELMKHLDEDSKSYYLTIDGRKAPLLNKTAE